MSEHEDENCGCDNATKVVERAIHEIDVDSCMRMQLGVAITKAMILTDILKRDAGNLQTSMAILSVGTQLRRYLKDHDAEVQAALQRNVASSTGKTH